MQEELKNLQQEIEQLKERVTYLEKLTKAPDSALFNTLPVPAPKPAPASKTRFFNLFNWRDSEEKLAGTWFNWLGILAIMLAVSFFLKWSFDNGLLGPLGRIATGAISGIGFLAAGEYFQRQSLSVYSQCLTGGGIGILYFSVYAAFTFYNLLAQVSAFILMILTTVTAVLIAIRYNSQIIGIIGIVGGFATPFLLSGGAKNLIFLFTYIAILNIGVLLLAFSKKWFKFNYLTFIFTYATFSICSEHLHLDMLSFLPVNFTYLTFFFIIYLNLSLFHLYRFPENLQTADTVLLLTNALLYLSFSCVLLAPLIGNWLGLWAIFLGLLYLIPGLLLYRTRPQLRKQSLSLFAVTIFFITIAIPLQLNIYWQIIALATEATILTYLNFKITPAQLPLAGLLIVSLATVMLSFDSFYITGNETLLLFSTAAINYLACITALVIILWLCRQQMQSGKAGKNTILLLPWLFVACNLLISAFLTLEIFAYYNYQIKLLRLPLHLPSSHPAVQTLLNQRDLVCSLSWGLNAAILVLLGFWRQIRGLRIYGLFFLGLVVLKVFFYDLSKLSTPNRILSFLVLGILLLTISWLYQRYKNFLNNSNDGN